MSIDRMASDREWLGQSISIGALALAWFVLRLWVAPRPDPELLSTAAIPGSSTRD